MFPGRGKTYFTSDLCFLDRGQHITGDMCFQGRGTHITSGMCFPGRGKHIAREQVYDVIYADVVK